MFNSLNALLLRVGTTLLHKKININSFSGSTQNTVPVNPRCPNVDAVANSVVG
jgi:hypothetical protein